MGVICVNGQGEAVAGAGVRSHEGDGSHAGPSRLYLVTKGVGLGEAQWRNDDDSFDDPIQLTIDRESSLAGAVLSPDGKPAAT